jgi:hypothetical protein
MATQFQYVPLPTEPAYIRLLRLLPGKSEEPILCELSQIELNAAKDVYIAASYTWGSEERQQQVLLNGAAFLVRKNLYDMLQAFRLRDDSLLLWIDAICIDQSSISERNYQVREMGRIYRQAREVHTWLGPAYPDSEEAFDQLNRCLRGHFKWYKKHKALSVTEMSWPLEILRQSSYWTRIWIVQELVLAQKITLRCGDSRLAWHEFEDERDRDHLYQSLWGTSIFEKIYDMRRHHWRRRFEEIFANFANLKCADDLDKFYSLHGMVDIDPASLPLPNYGMCVVEVFRCHLVQLSGKYHDGSGEGLPNVLELLWNFTLYFPRLLTEPTACGCHGSKEVNIKLRIRGHLVQYARKGYARKQLRRAFREGTGLFEIKGGSGPCCLSDSEEASAAPGDVVVQLDEEAPFLSFLIRKSPSTAETFDTCVGWAVAVDNRSQTVSHPNARRLLGLRRPAGRLADFVQHSDFAVDRQNSAFVAVRTKLSLLIGLGRLVTREPAKTSVPVLEWAELRSKRLVAGIPTFYCGYHGDHHR